MTNSEKTGLFAEWFPLAELCRIGGCCVAGSQDKTLLQILRVQAGWGCVGA